jgi:hypothetical protein
MGHPTLSQSESSAMSRDVVAISGSFQTEVALLAQDGLGPLLHCAGSGLYPSSLDGGTDPN